MKTQQKANSRDNRSRVQHIEKLGQKTKFNPHFPLSGSNLLSVGMYDHAETCPALCEQSYWVKRR